MPAGRPTSPETQAVHNLLNDKGDLTFQEAEPALTAQGTTVTDTQFNAAKQSWKRKTTKKPRNKTNTVSVTDAVTFVTQNGGLKAVEKDLLYRTECVKVFKNLLKSAA